MSLARENGILKYLFEKDDIRINLMEVCGTHTHAIARAGIKALLPDSIRLISGPGCPVCVTAQETIDAYLTLSERDDVIIATYGDMIRVPGSERGDNLARRRALGSHVAVVYSPVDAVDIAANNPDKTVVFLGVGFETTAPGTAASIGVAKERNVHNYCVYSMLKRVEPALRALLDSPDFDISGFIVPGHVAAIIGESGFDFLSSEYKKPSVITGFEPEDIMGSIYSLIKQIRSGRAELENKYERLVKKEGNIAAIDAIEKYLYVRDDVWRGFSNISKAGFGIKEEYSDFDAEKRFDIKTVLKPAPAGCLCGEIIKGRKEPLDCRLFGCICTPEDPIGPCMVSGEGACSAAFKYRSLI